VINYEHTELKSNKIRMSYGTQVEVMMLTSTHKEKQASKDT